MLSARGESNGCRKRHTADAFRYTAHPNGYHAAVRLSEDYALRARTELDIDDPSIDTLQALLLLAVAFTASGQGKKAYMMLGAYTLRSRDSLANLSSERHWDGNGSGVAPRSRPEDQAYLSGEGDAKTTLLDLLSYGPLYSLRLEEAIAGC